jgi:hypothetical protein
MWPRPPSAVALFLDDDDPGVRMNGPPTSTPKNIDLHGSTPGGWFFNYSNYQLADTNFLPSPAHSPSQIGVDFKGVVPSYPRLA